MEFNPDADLENADWPKRISDTTKDLGKEMRLESHSTEGSDKKDEKSWH